MLFVFTHTNAMEIKNGLIFVRVVTLEQRTYQQTILLEETRQKIQILEQTQIDQSEMIGRLCNGRFSWRIVEFTSMIAKMRENPNYVVYSPDFYTSPTMGYRLCLRCNIHVVGEFEYLAIFLHVMAGADDDILDWPLQGHVVLTLKTTCGITDLIETMETTNGLAFQMPKGKRNNIGYGM